MTLWILLALLAVAAAAIAGWPFLRPPARAQGRGVAALIFVFCSSAALYAYLGSPGVISGAGQLPDVDQMVEALAERLESRPDDVNGWKMLGRSYATLGNFDDAATAYERAIELESAQNGQTLADLGEVLVARNGQRLTPESASLFENALALEPRNSAALFWGGIGAVSRGDSALAAARWELLLETDPPPRIREVLQQGIAEWRGEPVPEAGPPASVVRARIEVADSAKGALPVEAVVYVIARDPDQPSPPIAVVRRRLSELPAVVELGDSESMIEDRLLSGFAEFELLARVSVSGQPKAQAGDWYGSVHVKRADAANVVVSIDSQIP